MFSHVKTRALRVQTLSVSLKHVNKSLLLKKRERKKNEQMNKNVLLVYIFYVLYECIQFHLIKMQNIAILLIFFSISDLISV